MAFYIWARAGFLGDKCYLQNPKRPAIHCAVFGIENARWRLLLYSGDVQCNSDHWTYLNTIDMMGPKNSLDLSLPSGACVLLRPLLYKEPCVCLAQSTCHWIAAMFSGIFRQSLSLRTMLWHMTVELMCPWGKLYESYFLSHMNRNFLILL